MDVGNDAKLSLLMRNEDKRFTAGERRGQPVWQAGAAAPEFIFRQEKPGYQS